MFCVDGGRDTGISDIGNRTAGCGSSPFRPRRRNASLLAHFERFANGPELIFEPNTPPQPRYTRFLAETHQLSYCEAVSIGKKSPKENPQRGVGRTTGAVKNVNHALQRTKKEVELSTRTPCTKRATNALLGQWALLSGAL